MDNTANLGLPFIVSGQAQKHVTHNDALKTLDAVVQLVLVNVQVDTPTQTPTEGDAFGVGDMPTAQWAGKAGQIAVWQDGAWRFITPSDGWCAVCLADDSLRVFKNGSWQDVVSQSVEALEILGINATGDVTNRFALASDASLFSHLTGDHRLKINKADSIDTASLHFQTDFNSHAEIGLTGNNNLSVRVSSDGTNWRDAMSVDADTGRVGIGVSEPAYNLEIDGAVGLTGAPLFVMANTGVSGTGQRFALRMYSRDSDTDLDNLVTLDMSVANTASGDETAEFRIWTTSQGNALMCARFQAGLRIGAPAGGDRGAGTINAQAIYDDNALLSCYVFDQALDGEIDDSKWDARTPDVMRPIKLMPSEGEEPGFITEKGRHAPMRQFKSRIRSAYDPLTLDGYARHWREKRHLTSMPNETHYDPEAGLSAGEWIQRLIETVEIQAVLIETLNQRTKYMSP